MPKRDETSYEIEAVSKTILVLLALEGTNFEPVTIQKIEERTGFKRNFCQRALITLKIHGFADQLPDKRWIVGTKVLKFSQRYSELCIAVLNK